MKSYLPAILNLGNLYYTAGDCKSARDYYLQASEIDPQNPRVLLNLARANNELENDDEARRYFDKLKQVDPHLADQFAFLVRARKPGHGRQMWQVSNAPCSGRVSESGDRRTASMIEKSKTAAFSLLLALLVGRPLTAQQLSISYVDGKVSLKNGSSWQALSIGDTIPADATLRVEPHAYVEFSTGDAQITLSQPGAYLVKNLLSALRSLRSAGVAKALNAVLSKLRSRPSPNHGSAGGARAADESKSEDSDWMNSDADVFLKAGKDFIDSGQFDKAIKQLKQAVDAAGERERAEARYYLAEAYSLNGETRNALTEISDLQPEGNAGWAADYTLLKGEILVEVSAYDQAVKWLIEKGGGLSADAERMQSYFFLLGLAYRGAGDSEKEKQSLARVVSISGDSGLGEAATKLMQDQ